MPLTADEQFHVRCAIDRLSGRLVRVKDANDAAGFLRRLLAGEPAPAVIEEAPSPIQPHPDAMWLTRAQARCLSCIEEYIREQGTSPTFEEIMVALGLSSKSGVSRLVKALSDRKRIRADRYLARSIVVIAPLTEQEKRL